jgi:hypothetical protein
MPTNSTRAANVERFRQERTVLIALKLPHEMHDRVLAYLARRAGLECDYQKTNSGHKPATQGLNR